MTPDQALAEVALRRAGRTRYEGQPDFLDEVLADEITQLRGLLAEWEQRAEARQQRIIRLTLERNAYRKAVDRVDPAAGHRIAKEFEEKRQ